MRGHVLYLAVIAVLILVVVCAAAKAVRAGRILAEVEDKFGVKEVVRASQPRKGGGPLRQPQGEGLLAPRTFDQYQQEIDSLLERAQSLEEFGAKSRLSEACRKALTGGKRLRAIIVLEVARATSVRRLKAHRERRLPGEEPSPADAGEVALFVEYLHTASLVIDDHPDFDDDSTRRGRPSLHAEVGPAVAQMAALALVAAAFQSASRQLDWLRDHCPEMKNVDRIGTRLLGEVGRALGALGAAGGQYMDVSSAEELAQEHGPDALVELMYRKTATFFEIAVLAGWLVAGGEAQQTSVMRGIGRHLGMAFQIADDVGDMAQDAERASRGKPGRNFANEYGRDVAVHEMERYLRGARLLLVQCSLWTPLWEKDLYPRVRAMAAGPGPAALTPAGQPS